MTRAIGTFEVKSFDEETIEELDGGTKVTRARVVAESTGDLAGEMATEYVMYYRPDGTARFVGYQRFTGTLAGRSGGFVEELVGGYQGTEAKSKLTVVDGSGTGELAGLRGKGTSAIPHGSTGKYTLSYELG